MMSKRFSATTPLKRSITPSSKKRTSTSSHKQLQSDAYFCHYKNAMYMGGIKTFQKHGKGIMIHDEGASIITSYHLDMKHGHNIVFMENCVMSIEYNKNKVSECAIRVPNYLQFLSYNNEQQLDGKSILIDYQNRKIYYAIFKKNVMVQKNVEKQYSVINRVFDLDNLEFLLGINHAKVFKYEFDKTEHIMPQKTNLKLNVGFYRGGLLNGLGFTLIIKNTHVDPGSDTSRRGDYFYIKLAERGFFLNSQLTGMGEKWFKNGNQYIGDFKADVFEGRGLLKNTLKNNWVYGSFESGNLVDLIDFNNQGDTKKLTKILEGMHERKSSWINKDVSLQDPNFFLKQIDKFMEDTPKNKNKSLEQRKYEVLRKIQDNFICDPPSDDPMNSSRNIYNYYHQDQDKRTQKKANKQPQLEISKYSQQFLNSPKKDSPPISSSPQHTSPQTKYQYFTGSGRFATNEPQQYQNSHSYRSKYREAQVEEKDQQKNKNNILKLYEVPTTKESSSRNRPINNSQIQKQQREQSAQKLDIQMRRGKAGLFRNYPEYSGSRTKNYTDYSPSKSKYSKTSAVERQPQANLDSKRLIGRSRLFKYLGNQEEESPPRFNYQPVN